MTQWWRCIDDMVAVDRKKMVSSRRFRSNASQDADRAGILVRSVMVIFRINNFGMWVLTPPFLMQAMYGSNWRSFEGIYWCEVLA